MSFADSYAFLDEWVITALQALGIDASYQPLNDITEPDGQDRRRRAEAARQRRRAAPRDDELRHGRRARWCEVLRIGREKLSDKGTKSAAKRVDPLRSQTGLPRAEIIDRMIDTFRGLYGLHHGEITAAELDAAPRQLVDEKFGTDEWLYRVP